MADYILYCGENILDLSSVMSKHSLRFRLSALRNKPKNLILWIAGSACLTGSLVLIVSTGMISAAALANLIVNMLRVLFFAYLLFSIVQAFKVSGRGNDRNT